MKPQPQTLIETKPKPQSDFIWNFTRIGLLVLIFVWVLSAIIQTDNIAVNQIIGISYMTAGIFTFVTSIIHLTKYKEKGFAITALVISSISIILIVVGLIEGFIAGLLSKGSFK